MAMKFKDIPNEKEQLVDVHGRSFPLYVVPQTLEECAAVADLQQTGFGIYQSSYDTKLSTVQQSDFNEDYHTYMLEAAAKYMLENKQIFKEDQILSTISRCQQELLKNAKRSTTRKDNFLQEREIESTSDDGVSIRINNSSTPKSDTFLDDKVSINSFYTPKANTSQDDKAHNTRSRQSLSFPKKKCNKENSKSQINTAAPSISYVQQNLPTFSQKKPSLQQNTDNLKTKEPTFKLCFPRGDVNEVSKSRNKRSALNKVPTVVHDCVVTCIDKSNCIWVRDVTNAELFMKVFNMANEEAAQRSTALKPWHTDKVYLAKDDNYWFRCKIIKYLPLTVIFLDYGNVNLVDEVREMSEELANIPSLAVRITFKAIEYKPVLEDEIKIKVFMQNDDGTYLVNVLGKLQNSVSKRISNSNLSTILRKPTKAPKYFHNQNYVAEVKNGLRVVIIYEENNLLYLRCSDGTARLKELEDVIKEHSKSLQKVGNVCKNESCLYRDRIDNQLKRVVVQEYIKSSVQVEYVDFIKNTSVELDSLYKTTEEISSVPITHLPAKKLVGFTNRDFGVIERQLIKQFIESQKEYTIVCNSDSSLDLQDGSHKLSDLLQSNGRVTLKDIEAFKPEAGLDAYLCGCFINSSDFSVVSANALKQYQADVFQTDVGTEPYAPLINEACLALYDGDYWYRCVVIRILNDDYEVLFVDFGNMERIEKKNIRKASEETWKTPALALPCRLTNLSLNTQVEEKLRQLIRIGEIYQVDIKDIANGKYNAEIPSVYDKLKAL